MDSRPVVLQAAAIDQSLGSTPVMGEGELARATSLCMAQVKPPLRIPGYSQEEFLGRGAFGEVWKAVDSNSGRIVAIKFYNRRGGLDWSHMSREVEKLQYLFSDRHAVQLFDIGWEANPPYYVMEYMKNGSLEDRLKEHPMSLAESLDMIRNIAIGLVGAHDRGILHCDLKPDNIMLDDEGNPRLADFGQSRLKHEHAPAVGTLFYMAPEQAELSKVPDTRWDVYALGAILYRMVTGKLPFLSDETAQLVSSQTTVDARLHAYSTLLHSAKPPTEHYHVPWVDSALRQIIDRCLAVNPKHRYPNVQAMLHDLALRQSKQAQGPLLMLGILGPAIVVLVMSLVSFGLFNQTLITANENLLQRTSESNQFAARSVAERFAMVIDRRWQILEQEAANEELQNWLQADGDISHTPDAINEWLHTRYEYWNTQFSEKTTAAYWYVLDRGGMARAITPSGDQLVGKYFGYREYFHGQGKQLDPQGAAPMPINAPHRSNVFRSQPNNRPAVSLSVPIRSKASQEVIGVLVMEAELGHFAEFQGTRNQVAVLVDLRPDDRHRRGLIVEHPLFDTQLRSNQQLGEYYVDPATLEILDTMQHEEFSGAKESTGMTGTGQPMKVQAETTSTVLDSYRDPVLDESEDLFVVAEPIVFRRDGSKVRDSDWVLLIQESRARSLAPLDGLRTMMMYGGMTALVLVVAIMAALWWLVIFVQNAPTRLRASQWWSGRLTVTSSTAATGSLSLSNSAVRDTAKPESKS